jgi:hypothetical protein
MTRSIDYDASKDALYHPEHADTLFHCGFDYSAEQLCVECSRLAYIRFETGEQEMSRLSTALVCAGFQQYETFLDAQSDSQAFAAAHPKAELVLVAFRGTQGDKITDLATDLRASVGPWTEKGGMVHDGFARAFRGIRGQIEQWLTNQACPTLILTGHSLGAALATLAASVWNPAQLVTFGSPRVGNADFASTVTGCSVSRFVNCCDVVTHLAPESEWYTHAGERRYIDREGSLAGCTSDGDAEEDQLVARAEYVRDYAWHVDSVPVRDLADHAPINYVRAFWSAGMPGER